MSGHPDRFLAIARDVEARGWSCQEGFIEAGLAGALLDEAQRSHRQGDFRSGAVGTPATRAVRPDIRGDEIRWLTADSSAASRSLAAALEDLRLALNRELQLGLFDHEAHFARYAPGTCYGRHFDRPSESKRRILSMALYLNRAWHAEEGGALRLYMGLDAPPVDLLPESGRLVLFLSDRFEHEVLPATRERWSVTGWFCQRD